MEGQENCSLIIGPQPLDPLDAELDPDPRLHATGKSVGEGESSVAGWGALGYLNIPEDSRAGEAWLAGELLTAACPERGQD